MSESDQNTTANVSNDNAKRILALLEEGEKKIYFDLHRDVVLILGNTGSGKTTFTHFVAGNNDDLFSTEVGEDSGEFIYTDSNNKINYNTTVISKTIYPELWFDTDTKTAFVDCPGFNGHDETYDIATSYFIKKVLDKAQRVKIVLIVNYSSLRKGGNGNDFLQLLQHVTASIKNIGKYVDSVALVASKVDNTYFLRRGVPEMIPDHAIVEQIAKFLQEVKTSLKIMQNDVAYTPKFKLDDRKVFQENAIKLLESLLSKKETGYTRIGIFRRPNEAGKISHIELLQNGKKILKTMVLQNLKYLPIDKADIGYSVSDKSKIVIRELVNEVNDKVASDFALIAQHLLEFYDELEIEMFNDDVYALHDQLGRAFVALKQIVDIDRSASMDELVNTMCANFTHMTVKVPKSYIRDIKYLHKFLLFLQEIDNQKFEPIAWKYAKELETVVNAVHNSFKWYSFLGKLHDRLSEYDIQKNITTFHLPQLETKDEISKIDKFNNFYTFIDELVDANNLLKGIVRENVKEIFIDATKYRYFDQLINVTLKEPIITCTDDSKRLEVTGEYVILSQITKNQCFPNSASIQILATHSIFIDTDLTAKNDIFIISPHWHVVGSRNIILDGTNGHSHLNPKANNGSCDGCDGENGLPGNPGKSGGHFFGIGSAFENSEKLFISANGGNGGNGQHGGDGKAGRRGNRAVSMKINEYWNEEKIELFCEESQTCYSTIDYYASQLVNGHVKYTVRGSVGGKGGNAGRGGAGGEGGKPGTITLIGSHNISTSENNGFPGAFGLHGECGEGGKGGYDISITYSNNYYSSKSWQYETDREGDPGASGTCLYISNEENANHEGLQKPTNTELYSPSATISNFMIQLMKNFDNCITRKASRKFFAEFANNQQLKSLYNFEFVKHSLQKLQHYDQFTHDTSTTFYQFLLEKIIQDAKTTLANETDRRTELEMLHLVISSKLITLKSKLENLLPDNRQKYFDTLANENFNEILNYNTTTKKIADTVKFTETLINSELEDAIGQMDFEIARMSQNNSYDELDDLLLKRKVFSCLQFFNHLSNFALSMANADLTISNGMKILQFSPSVTFQPGEIPIYNEAFLNLERYFNEFELETSRKIDAMTWVISNEHTALQATGDEYEESCKRLRNLEKALHSFTLTKRKTFISEDLINNTLLTFDEINIGLIKLATENDDLEKIIRKYQSHMKLIQFDIKMYQNIKSESNIEHLINAVDRVTDINASQLNNTMQSFFDVVNPILKAIHPAFTNTGYKPNDTTKIRLMLQEGLTKAKFIFDSMTEQLEMDEDLQTLSENMDEVFTTLINIYDHFNSVEERSRLNVMLHYAEDHFGTVHDNDTEKIMNSLRTNALVYEYEQSVDVFKRYVFPLDTLHPSNVTIPSIVNFDQNLSNVKSSIAAQVKTFESNLDAVQKSEYLLQDYFNRTSTFGPFFVWKNEVCRNAVKKFLRGREIALKAIPNENDSHEMIKFDSINLGFRLSNDTMQQLLDDILINFSIRLTHSGNSHYKFCNRNQLLYSDSTSLTYNFNETGVNMEPTLSPYTTWILKLDPIDANVSFSSLEPFRQQQVDLLLQGRANYISAQNQSVCDKFLTDPEASDYTSLMTNNTVQITLKENSSNHSSLVINNTTKITPEEDSSNLNRTRRDVSSKWNSFMPSFKENLSFLKSINPFNYFIGANSQTDQSSSAKSLEWNTESSTSTSTVQFSSNLNHTLTFLDYLVRNVTKVKPYNATTASNLDQVRVTALEIVDKFETMLSALGNKTDIPPSQLELDPIQLMSELEKEIINGNPAAIGKILRNSVTLDSQFEDRFDAELAHMLDQMNDHSNQDLRIYQNYILGPLRNYTDGTITNVDTAGTPPIIENHNTSTSLLN